MKSYDICIELSTVDLFFCVFQNGDTALHIAAAQKRRKIARILVDAGVNCSIKNKVTLSITLCRFSIQVVSQQSYITLCHIDSMQLGVSKFSTGCGVSVS